MDRRELLRWSCMASAIWLERMVWPLDVSAQGVASPRGTAKNCIVIQLGGGISQIDCWDFKETVFTPGDLDVVRINSDLSISRRLFPQLSKEMHRVSLVRSMRAPEIIHLNGQYHAQTGRALNPGIAKEIPAFGSVIAMELQHRRRASDTFPTYVSTSLATSTAGAIGSGFLPPQFSALDLDANTVLEVFGGNTSRADTLLETRWQQLGVFLNEISSSRSTLGVKATEFMAFYDDAYRMLTDPRWPGVFKASNEDKTRYGDDEFGLGCILARNILATDAGTRFVFINDGNGSQAWDHHVDIFSHSNTRNHYYMCNRLDKGLVSLMNDLTALPGSTPGTTLLDDTMIVVTSEFGRTPQMNAVSGRDHYNDVFTSMFLGGGVKPGRIIGKTDDTAARCVDTGWNHRVQPYLDNMVASIYSAMGIDWLKRIDNTPSGRAYDYIETAPLGGSEIHDNDEIAELFV